MSKVEVNQISSQCGSTLTIGQSGDTVTLAAGATQTGFGRTGTVNWDTTAKTASFTAVSGNGYFVNTTSGAITVTMPATPSAGDIVGIKDYAGTFATNNVTVGRNGSNFDGVATDATLSTDQLSVLFVYVDGTQGWKTTQNDSGSYGAAYISATGGTVTCCGDYKTHIFTSPGTFCVSCAGNADGSNTVEYLVVAGGGGGGSGCAGGAGGAGGMRLRTICCSASPLNGASNLPVSASAFPITVGGGGAGGPFSIGGTCSQAGTSGSNSVFSTITSTGGGGGGTGHPTGTPVPTPSTPNAGLPGGSGGGGGHNTGVAGIGNTPPVSPSQGFSGSASVPCGVDRSGGGGGASAASSPGPAVGGDGSYIPTTFIGPTAPSYGETGPQGRFFAGGAGGSNASPGGGTPAGAGGLGGGGDGVLGPGVPGNNGSTNMGGGGSGGAGGSPGNSGGAGGSGIVIIRYKYQ